MKIDLADDEREFLLERITDYKIEKDLFLNDNLTKEQQRLINHLSRLRQKLLG